MIIINKNFYGTGRRKTSTARVFLCECVDPTGNFLINKQPIHKYFNLYHINRVNLIMQLLKIENKFDFYVTVKGGGLSSQSQAIIHGIARALLKYNISLYKNDLKKYKLLTRDSRKVERKKVGLKKSRKATQYSKR